MYKEINTSLYKEHNSEEDNSPVKKITEQDTMFELRKIMASVPCADEKYALYEKSKQVQRQYE